MKKALQKGLAFFTCLALLCSVLITAPLLSSAQSVPQAHVRIEGAQSEVYAGNVDLAENETLADILNALYAGGKIGKPDISDAGFLNSIGSSADSADTQNKLDVIPAGNTYLRLIINGAGASDGVNVIKPRSNDDIVIALVAYDDSYNDITHYPTVTLSPASPVAGQTATVHVSCTYQNWGAPAPATDLIENATVVFNGQTVGKTNAKGELSFSVPATPGSYSMDVSDDQPGKYPLIIRTGDIPVSVGSAPSQPKSGNFNMTDNTVNFNVIDNAGGKSALLSSDGFQGSLKDAYSRTYSLQIPGDTVISGSASWDGSFRMPTPVDASTLNVSGGSVRLAVEAGNPDEDLTLNKTATITLPGQSGKEAGYFDKEGHFYNLPRLSVNAAPADGSEGYFDDAANNALIIYTRHFSTFTAYLPASSVDVSDSRIDAAIASAAAFLASHDSSDWTAFALARAGKPVPDAALPAIAQTLAENHGNFTSPTELAKTALVLRAAGADPRSFNGYNLIEKLYDFTNADKSGLNGPVYLLLALDGCGYAAPAGAKVTADALIPDILSYQNGDGSFSLAKGAGADPDITAMAVTALSGHLDNSDVRNAVDAAVHDLSVSKKADGGYVPAGSTQEASESSSQVVIALSSAGVDSETDSAFLSGGHSPLGNLLGFQNSDGGFLHNAASGSSDVIATQQALLALEAYRRYEQGAPRLYDLTDKTAQVVTVNPKTGSSGIVPQTVTLIGAAALLLAAGSVKRKKYVKQ